MRAKLIIAAILVQFLVLGWMAGEREWILRTRPSVWLRTAPVDPRDLFRGDYVTLGYDISTIPAAQFGPGLKKHLEDWAARGDGGRSGRGREMVVYTALRVDPESGVAEIATADLTPPESGLFLKGRVRPYSSRVHENLTGVAYGIDAYYVQQGKGRELERRSPELVPDGVVVPMEMEIAVGVNGTAVLRGHRWNALGIGVEIQKRSHSESAPPAESDGEKKSSQKTLRITFYNASAAPLAVVLPSDLRTLHIQKWDGWNGRGEDVGVSRTGLAPLTDADVRRLPPMQSVSVVMDLSRAEWFVKSAAGPVPLGHDAETYQSYRVVYEPPPRVDCRALKDGGIIAPGTLLGRRLSSYELKEK
jgi:uncharacterized membrane-anchored protein